MDILILLLLIILFQHETPKKPYCKQCSAKPSEITWKESIPLPPTIDS